MATRTTTRSIFRDCAECGTTSKGQTLTFLAGVGIVVHPCEACGSKNVTDRAVVRDLAATTRHECDDRCKRAKSDLCLCVCEGKYHGMVR